MPGNRDISRGNRDICWPNPCNFVGSPEGEEKRKRRRKELALAPVTAKETGRKELARAPVPGSDCRPRRSRTKHSDWPGSPSQSTRPQKCRATRRDFPISTKDFYTFIALHRKASSHRRLLRMVASESINPRERNEVVPDICSVPLIASVDENAVMVSARPPLAPAASVGSARACD